MNDHPQAPVPGHTFEADADIVDLLGVYNDAGASTAYSCQGGASTSDGGAPPADDRGYIFFTAVSTLPEFLRITEELAVQATRGDIVSALRRLRHNRADSEPAQADHDEMPCQTTDEWSIEVQYNEFRGLDALMRHPEQRGVAGDMQEQLAITRAGWVYIVEAPAEHLRALNDAARHTRRRS